MQSISIKPKITEILGITYTPKIIDYFKKNNIVRLDGQPYTGPYIRNVICGLQNNSELVKEIKRLLIVESKIQKALNKKFSTI